MAITAEGDKQKNEESHSRSLPLDNLDNLTRMSLIQLSPVVWGGQMLAKV